MAVRQKEQEIAVASDNDSLPKAAYNGVIKIGDSEINCFVITKQDDNHPIRLLSGRAVTNALGLTGRGQGMSRFVDSKSLKPFIPTELERALREPVPFIITAGLPVAQGYTADVLPMLCYAIIDAHDAQLMHFANSVMSGEPSTRRPVFSSTQRSYEQAKILARAFSTVGINALVDEATGYQEVRDKLALQTILDRYIVEEWRKHWEKTFPEEYYKHIFRLRGWHWSNSTSKRPGLIGHITNDIVYSRLAPGVLKELKERVPKNEDGKPTRKLFLGLTEDVGVPSLKNHLDELIILMRASISWNGFYALVNRSYDQHGKHTKTASLPGLEIESLG